MRLTVCHLKVEGVRENICGYVGAIWVGVYCDMDG